VNAPVDQERHERFQLSKSHEGLAADDRKMQRAMARDDIEDAVDELLALEVGELPQHDVAAEMRVAVRVASGTPERTFAGDFD
jgi:hypothetical protein